MIHNKAYQISKTLISIYLLCSIDLMQKVS